MLRKKLAVFLIALLALGLSAGAVYAATFIQDLVHTRKVEANVTFGNAAPGGEPGGYSALGVFQNRTSKPLKALIPCGLVLCAAPGRQDRIVGRDLLITLAPGKWVRVTIYNFCIERNEKISYGETLKIGSITPDDKLLAALRTADKQGLMDNDPETVQANLWAITGGAPPADEDFSRLLGGPDRPRPRFPQTAAAAILYPIVAWAALIFVGLIIAAVYSVSRARSAERLTWGPERQDWIERPHPPRDV